MSDEAVARGVLARSRGRTKSESKYVERRSAPRPPLAEIRVGANLKLVPPIVIIGAVRMTEFLIVAALGFGIYLGYVEREGQNAHVVYLVTVLTAALANTNSPLAQTIQNVYRNFSVGINGTLKINPFAQIQPGVHSVGLFETEKA
jgi:hypothetical protein